MSDQETVATLVAQIVDGWYEKIEYNKPVQVHTEACRRLRMKCPPGRLRHYTCRCMVRLEPRTDRVRQTSLLDQLIGEVSGYSPVSMGSRWGKPGSRPPGTLDMVDMVSDLDEWLRTLTPVPRRTIPERARALVTLAGDGDAEWNRMIIKHLRRFVRTARIVLRYDVPKAALRDAVCGECKGTLVVAVDAESDVRCIAEGCGVIYPRYTWMDLLEVQEDEDGTTP